MLVNHFLEHSASRLPEKIALICGEKRLSYRKINDAAERLASSLTEIGIRRQDRVVIFLDNAVESVISLFGILKTGAIFIMLNPAMKSKKLSYILRDSGARALITPGSKASMIKDAVTDAVELRDLIWVGSPSVPFRSMGMKNRLWEELLSPALSPRPSSSVKTIDVDLATIIYTSGSTGDPKGVMSAHCNMVAAAKSITQYLENVEQDIILDALPLSFDYGLYQVLMAFLFGGTVVLEKSFAYPYKILERIAGERVTGFPLVPTMAAIMLQMDNPAAFDLKSLRYITNTAAALPVAYIRRLRDLLPHVRIYSMYGLTECKRVAYLPHEEIDKRPGSVGIPIPNEEVFIVDNTGREVGPGEAGELVIRGSNVMQGYWNAPDETARTFRPGRYRGETLLYSGDLFRRDEEGFLYFVARKDDMIKTKGERVSPKEVENTLCELTGVAEAAVKGVPDEISGQVIKAYIVRDRKTVITEEAVLKHCMKNLEPFMVPKYVEFLDSFQKTPTGKIDKKALA